ncbi:amidohydrolase family protein [Algoriphagus halophilus]|uniref:Amidohydrolase family protein n=1 Tax=Algoriphagus halophilus TaxID=226505 RepID=A0A1N6DUG8_9BACT|nr:amidohydrolase family protein [Algoriphagus halophilus]SIN74401.1 Amidohydrolase family protein [Algoriphagus halophilus]
MNYSILLIFLLVSISSGYSQSIQSDTTIYDVVFRENNAGSYKKWQTTDRSFGYYYTYTDRGRGPKYKEEISLNSENFIINQRIKGFNYLNVPIDESFSSKESTGLSKNMMGTTQGNFNGDQLYFRYDGSPATYEVLAQLILKSETGQVDLYPQGTTELIKKIPFTLSNGTSVELLVIKGLELDPTYIWMMGDKMVCMISGNLHIIRQDLSGMRLEMKAIQDNIEDESLKEVAQNLTHKLDQAVIQNVNVFTRAGTLLSNQDVIVEAGKIKAILKTGGEAIEQGVTIIDGTGKTLLPGMFDMHTHNDKFRGIMHLAGGVTSVRDLANNKQLKSLAAQFERNEIIGPNIVIYSGIIDGPGPFANQRNVIENLEEGLAEIQGYKDLGYQQIKLYSSIKPEWVLPLADKAHQLGMRVSGHIPAYMTATQAINQGYNEIQHINMLFLNFLSDTIDTRTPLRFTMPAQYGADLDLQSQEYHDFIKLLTSKNILVDPTVAIFENMFVSQLGELSPTYQAIANRFPIIEQRSFYSGGIPKAGAQVSRYKESFEKMLAVVADLFRQGVAIVPGTDGLPGFLYHRELELYVKAGIPAFEVLKMATIKSAEITGLADKVGAIEVGKQADLILIDGNPLAEISDIRKIEWTMKGGNLYYSKELYSSLGVKCFN